MFAEWENEKMVATKRSQNESAKSKRQARGNAAWWDGATEEWSAVQIDEWLDSAAGEVYDTLLDAIFDSPKEVRKYFQSPAAVNMELVKRLEHLISRQYVSRGSGLKPSIL